MMKVYDVLYNIQTDARARLIILSLIERLEDTLTICLRDTHTIIADHDAEMLLIRFDDTTQCYTGLTVFIGIGKQVAHYLCDGFTIDDCRKTVVWVMHRELFAVLLERRFKTLAHSMKQFVDILSLEMTHQHVLLCLTEVE